MRRAETDQRDASIEELLGSDPKNWVPPDVFQEHFEELDVAFSAAFQRGYASGPRAIAFTSNESGAWAAVVFEKWEE